MAYSWMLCVAYNLGSNKEAIAMTENDARLILDVRISRFDHAGDVNEALEIAKQALEEIQKYREIGTVKECREAREKQKAKTRKTRKSKFLEMFPDAPITDGIPCVSPCDLSTKVTDKGGLCDEYSENSDCKECRRKYWLEEME